MPPTVTEPLVKTVRVIPPTIVIDQTSTVRRQLRTAAYCRVSTDSDEQELSFEAQVAAYTDKIMSNPEWSLVGIFADEGISGTQADNRAKQSDADSEEFLALSQEIAETKKRIAAKKEQQIAAHANEARMNEVLGTLDVLKNHPIDYDDSVTRKLVECIKVVSKNELLVIFKGGIEKTVRME